MSDLTIEFTDTLVVVTCWCGINHAVPRDLRNFQQRQHDNGEQVQAIYCPLGHTHVPSGEGKAQRLEQRLQWAREDAARQSARADQAEAHARAQKAAKTRIRRDRDRLATRAANGVCPCCNRTFKQLARHMSSQHPDYTPEASGD